MATQEENTDQLKPEDDFPVAEQPDEPTAPEPKKKIPVGSESRWQRFKNWYKDEKRKSIPLTVLVLILLLALIPWSRYQAAGLVLKKDFRLQIIDSTANTPVSEAVVSLGSLSATTDGSGKAILRGVKVGPHSVSISKKHYQNKQANVLVPIFGQKNTPSIQLVATGRQVKIVVSDLINRQKLSGVQIQVADIEAKTDKNGNALIVLPVGTKSPKASLQLEGYNDATFTVIVSDRSVQENAFKMTPAGKVYFLSKRTGRLDVMKANLDGSGVETAVEGTGAEQGSSSVLSQSADGKYVALVAKRNSADPTPQLYVLSTDDDKLLQADSGNVDFVVRGWIGDNLVYTLARKDLQLWQQGLNRLKVYEATTGKITLLDQSSGSDAEIKANEYYDTVITSGHTVVFAKSWNGSGDLGGKQDSLHTIDAGGQNHKTIATYSASDSLAYVQHSPISLYISQQVQGAGSPTFFDFTLGASPQQISLSNEQFYATARVFYFFSPSAKQTFWAELRDGKNTLLVADGMGGNAKTIATLSDYAPYGWYSDKYALVSKNANQLYIMDIKGGTPVKIADFQASS